MPLLDYKNRETGEVREIKASSDLDNFTDEEGTWERLEVPTRFAIGGQRSFPTQAQTMKRGYYRQENSKRGWRSTYSKNKVKRVWGI
jgi:hypothetical protein